MFKLVERVEKAVIEAREAMDNQMMLERSFKRQRERARNAFDDGWNACIAHLERGASIERLRDISIATARDEWEDTEPYYVLDEEITQVDSCIPVEIFDV